MSTDLHLNISEGAFLQKQPLYMLREPAFPRFS